jgi:hypothetical protein
LYNAAELTEALGLSGFRDVTFGAFPLAFAYLATWGHVVDAKP